MIIQAIFPTFIVIITQVSLLEITFSALGKWLHNPRSGRSVWLQFHACRCSLVSISGLSLLALSGLSAISTVDAPRSCLHLDIPSFLFRAFIIRPSPASSPSGLFFLLPLSFRRQSLSSRPSLTGPSTLGLD
ncbi:hypothetical protein BDW62DRAFT_85573 [Aspergillus aurantiobrunneus]